MKTDNTSVKYVDKYWLDEVIPAGSQLNRAQRME